MRLLALVPYLFDTKPSQRFRFEQWEPLLHSNGIQITFAPFEDHALLYVVD